MILSGWCRKVDKCHNRCEAVSESHGSPAGERRVASFRPNGEVMMKIRSRILFSENNGYFFIARCFSIKTLNIRKVQDGNVNILAVTAFQTTYFSRYLLLTIYVTRKSGQSALSLPTFMGVFLGSCWVAYPLRMIQKISCRLRRISLYTGCSRSLPLYYMGLG